jgi:hypothetical protein
VRSLGKRVYSQEYREFESLSLRQDSYNEAMNETISNQHNVIEVDGKFYRRFDTGYTIREYYSHHTDRGPGPGWDFRMSLLDSEYSQKRFGRTFSEKQVFNPSQLPDEPMYDLEEIE